MRAKSGRRVSNLCPTTFTDDHLDSESARVGCQNSIRIIYRPRTSLGTVRSKRQTQRIRNLQPSHHLLLQTAHLNAVCQKRLLPQIECTYQLYAGAVFSSTVY